MRTIALNGSSGFIGSQICNYFGRKYNIIRINRNDYLVDPVMLANKLEGADVILNIAGAGISLFSSKKKRQVIYNSRVETTLNLCKAMACMKRKPELFISMSAVGIYDGVHVHDEKSQDFGNDFLARLCIDWENAAIGCRSAFNTAIVRSGIVLSKNDGMLKQMLLPFKFGLGAILGSGNQPVPFIHIHDFLRAIEFVIDRRLTGIINFVAPKYCTNKEFSLNIARELRRPLLLRAPARLIKMLMGEQSSMVLEGQKVFPQRLMKEGFSFEFPDIQHTIKDLINTDNH